MKVGWFYSTSTFEWWFNADVSFLNFISLFNGISPFVGYLIPSQSAKEQQWYYLTYSWVYKGVHTFPKSKRLKVNANYDAYLPTTCNLFGCSDIKCHIWITSKRKQPTGTINQDLINEYSIDIFSVGATL